VEPRAFLTPDDLHRFREGTHAKLYEKLGARADTVGGIKGVRFAVWAPNALSVAVCGDFNDWNKQSHPLAASTDSGVWSGFVPGLAAGSAYKFHIVSRFEGYAVDKADPFGRMHEVPPKTASVVWDLDYTWGDAEWMAGRAAHPPASSPLSIYEVHLGSWRRMVHEGFRSLSYREIAPLLADYARDMGFTHVEIMPVMEHPYYASWGYQVTGYFAPTSRYGTPQDFMFLIDTLHQAGLGVILDWVPAHFPSDEHGLGYFDGTYLFEHANPMQRIHPEWESLIFNYGRGEVRSFLMSSALFWLDLYHADGLRVDGVASMLHLDYAREPGEWVPNEFGGRENLGAITFLRDMNEEISRAFPGVPTIAEESTSWPMVSRPTYVGGLGFAMKWDLGWMHDTLEYLALDPIYRRFHHGKLTFRRVYAYSENFVLPLSHDEVVHLKKSLLDKMPGDDWQKFANLRLLFGYQWAQPGKKLLFQGGEIGQWREWDHEGSVDWDFARHGNHQGLQKWVRDLNRLHKAEAALHDLDFDPAGFDWIDCNDPDQSTLSFLRFSVGGAEAVVAVFNFTPVPRHGFRLGVPFPGRWTELANSDVAEYGGSGLGNLGAVEAREEPAHGRIYSLEITLPPLATLFFKGTRPPEPLAPQSQPEATVGTSSSGEPEGESKVQSPKSKGARVGSGKNRPFGRKSKIQNLKSKIDH
jgi:1,4-alpha-glucan branching enzyme